MVKFITIIWAAMIIAAVGGSTSTAQVFDLGAANQFQLASGSTTSQFVLSSSPSSWIGHGYNFDLHLGDEGVGFSARTIYPNLGGVRFIVNAPEKYFYVWELWIDSPAGMALQPGRYTGATRFPFNGSGPGLFFMAFGRGNNDLVGEFTIHEIVLGTDGVPTKAAIDFIQYDEGHADRWNIGQLRYNSSYPIFVVPEPMLGAAVVSLSLLSFAAWRRRSSE